MKLPFKHIAILVLLSLAAIFAYQAYWLVNLFNSRSLHVFITKLRHKLAQDQRIRIINIRGIGYKMIVN